MTLVVKILMMVWDRMMAKEVVAEIDMNEILRKNG